MNHQFKLLTADEAEIMHAQRLAETEKNNQIEMKKCQRQKEENDKRYKELFLPKLIDDYIGYLACVQQNHQLPVNLITPPDGSEKILNDRLKPYGLCISSRMTDHLFDSERYTLERLKTI